MYHYGDESMDFLDAVFILRNRGAVEEAKRHLAPDIALAIKTITNGLDNEITKAKKIWICKGIFSSWERKGRFDRKDVRCFSVQRRTTW